MQSIDFKALSLSIDSYADSSEVVHGYDGVANEYDNARPDYPSEALDAFFSRIDMHARPRILDLACGTGKLTKALLKRGFRNITAIDPSNQMIAQCKQLFPEIEVIKGSAEMIPLSNTSLDVVVVGTAFHWFEGYKALNEIGRVLVRGGRLGLIWNMLNPEISWVSKIRGLLDADQTSENHDTLKWKKAFEKDRRFTPLQHETHHYTVERSPGALISCLLSFKAAGTMACEQIEQIKAKAYAILASDPLTAGKAILKIPYRVEFYWTQKIKDTSRSHIEKISQSFNPPRIAAQRSYEKDVNCNPPS